MPKSLSPKLKWIKNPVDKNIEYLYLGKYIFSTIVFDPNEINFTITINGSEIDRLYDFVYVCKGLEKAKRRAEKLIEKALTEALKVFEESKCTES